MRILVVEDERELSESLRELLAQRGFAAEAAYDGPAGLEYALTGVYDLVVLDVMKSNINWRLRMEKKKFLLSTPKLSDAFSVHGIIIL